MTSPEAVKRARSHDWVEINDQTEGCRKCKIALPKATNLENVPACTGILVIGPWRFQN